MARAAKASPAPQGKAAPVAASKAKASTPAKPAKAAAAAPTPAPAKTAKSKAPPPPPPPIKPATVTVKHLAANLADSQGLSRRDAESFAIELVADLVDQMKAGAKIRIAGLGILEIKNKPARMGRNPATGAPVQVAASRKVAFRVAKDLKEAI